MSRRKTNIGSTGDPMCEMNIQRRFQYLSECNPRGLLTFTEEQIKADPALQRAVLELPFVRLRKPPE